MKPRFLAPSGGSKRSCLSVCLAARCRCQPFAGSQRRLGGAMT